MPIHYRSTVVEKMTALLNIWWSPRFQQDIVAPQYRGMSTIEIRVIWTLGARGPLRSSDIVAEIGSAAPSVSKAVAKLDAAGLVTRRPNPDDRRAHALQLTAQGREVAQSLYDVGDAMVAEIFADWNEGDVSQLSQLLTRFVDESERYAKRIRRASDDVNRDARG